LNLATSNNQTNSAVIDIGSNTIRYMGAGAKRQITTRLAEGLLTTGALSQTAMNRSIDVIRFFVALAQSEGLIPRAYATSAVRDALNSKDFILCVEAKIGLTIDVLSGEDEARYAYKSAVHDGGNLIDIGGGSAQIVTEDKEYSFPMGCVRAKELIDEVVPHKATLSLMRRLLMPRFEEFFLPWPRIDCERWTGIGGTITTLGAIHAGLSCYDPLCVHGVVLNIEDIITIAQSLNDMVEARQSHPLLADRHDVIIPGTLILLYLMDKLNIKRLVASEADGMEGYRSYLQLINGGNIDDNSPIHT